MSKISTWIVGVVAVIALILSIGNMVGGNSQSASVGDSGTRFPNGISADNTSPIAGEVRGLTLNLATSNTATSTAKIGCVQTYATSTETPIHLEYNTTNATSTLNGTSAGLVAWKYGVCPV